MSRSIDAAANPFPGALYCEVWKFSLSFSFALHGRGASVPTTGESPGDGGQCAKNRNVMMTLNTHREPQKGRRSKADQDWVYHDQICSIERLSTPDPTTEVGYFETKARNDQEESSSSTWPARED